VYFFSVKVQGPVTGWFRYPETISKAAQDGEQYNSFSEVSGVACEPPSQGSRLALAQPHALGQVKTHQRDKLPGLVNHWPYPQVNKEMTLANH
jgi:hypothetical protein